MKSLRISCQLFLYHTSNPVKDFMALAGIENNNWFSEMPVNLDDDSDKGFLDFLAEIEENTNSLAKDIQKMTEEMETMTQGVSESSAKIERVNKTGGNGVASFARKETKKVAKYVEEFASKLCVHNKSIEVLWDNVEQSLLSLLENSFATHEDNKQNLVSYLKSLNGMQVAIANSNESVEALKKSMENSKGLERSLNQAIRFCVEDLSTYIGNTQRISISIDKIIAKSRFVVGDIIILEAGDLVPADARIFECASLKVNESSLTGESENVLKHNNIIDKKNVLLADRLNCVHSGSLVTYGRAKAIVTSVGQNTEIGKINILLQNTEETKTPLQVNLDKLAKFLM